MADDPWEQYLKPPSTAAPTSGADHWAQFTKPPSPAPAPAPAPSSDTPASFNQGPATLGQMSVFEKPADVSMSDFLLAHLASLGQGASQIGQTADDYVRAATNTFGLGDRFAAGMNAGMNAIGNYVGLPSLPVGFGGGDLAQQRATSAARAQADPVASTLGTITGFGPVGRLGMATDIAKAIAPAGSGIVRGALANATGTAAEGAAANYVSALGHGESPEDAEKAALIGGGIGAPLGVAGGVAERAFAGPGPTTPSAADLLATAKTGFTKAGNVLYDNADVRQAATNAIDEINQQPARIARNGQGALSTLNKIGNDYAIGAGAQSGEDLNDYIRSLKVAKTGDDVDVAGRIGQKHMQSVLDNATPITSGGQVPGQVGAGADAVNEANQAFGRSQDLQRLDDTPTVAALKKTQSYYQPGSPEYESLDAAIQGQSPAFNWYKMRHVLAPVAGAAIGGAYGYMNPAEGENPYLKAAKEAGEDAMLFGGLPLAAKAMARPQATMNAARYALATGKPYTAPAGPPISDALRTLIFGQMAARQ